MNEELIGEVVEELRPALVGRPWGKLFQLSAASFAVDLRAGGRYLFVSAEPSSPRLHMISRTVRELEKASQQPSPFALQLRKALGGATLRSVTRDEGERVVRFTFDASDALGEGCAATLVVQLTGRTSNVFLLDAEGRVVAAMRPARGEGQEEGDVYSPPSQPSAPTAPTRKSPAIIARGNFSSLSEALDEHYRRLERERAFDQRASAASGRIRQEISRLKKLRDNLERDLKSHGDVEEHRRAGELLLANVETAERRGRTVRVTDFYADGLPSVEFEVEENRSLQEEAGRRFALYRKAKRAAQEISERLKAVGDELAALEARRSELERITEARDAYALDVFTGAKTAADKPKPQRRAKDDKKHASENLRGVRRYRSSDGYEVLVGRGSADNDRLTFRVARSFDTWMHAADYPGSHVVVRARSRDDQVPHRTIVEAAQLAAHFSKAGKDSKAAVNYTQRKFVSKPRGAAPGLVYLSSFRTIMVEPREELERI